MNSGPQNRTYAAVMTRNMRTRRTPSRSTRARYPRRRRPPPRGKFALVVGRHCPSARAPSTVCKEISFQTIITKGKNLSIKEREIDRLRSLIFKTNNENLRFNPRARNILYYFLAKNNKKLRAREEFKKVPRKKIYRPSFSVGVNLS